MKKAFVFLLAIVLMAISTACSTTTITDKPGNYLYEVNEEISIIDIDSREKLGTVKITGIEILRDSPFEIHGADGTDENGDTKYKNVTYQQIIQIYYSYSMIDSSKSISSGNFITFDSTNTYANYIDSLESRPDYKEKPKEGSQSHVVAVKNKGNYIDIEFKYRLAQTKPTAKIRVNL